jgi:hypothetical protein
MTKEVNPVLEAAMRADAVQWEIGDALAADDGFDHVLEAVRKADAHKWEIGDALIAETGTRSNPKRYGDRPGDLTLEEWLALPYEEAKGTCPGSPIVMRDVAKELRKHGIEITANQLYRYRDTAEAYPPSSRRADIPWETHWAVAFAHP